MILHHPDLVQALFVYRFLARHQVIQRYKNLREGPGEPVNGAKTADLEDWEQLLAQASEDVKVGSADGWVVCDLCVHADVAVGEFGTDDVGVAGELAVGGKRDDKVIGDGWVVVTGLASIMGRLEEMGKHYIRIGIGLASATALNHPSIPS